MVEGITGAILGAPIDVTGDCMVFVKVRETFDLHTLTGKMSVIGVHTPTADIIKRNYPGLLLQCKGYRPVSCDIKLACASVLPVDPLGVGTSEGDVAPEDLFNPILYKACSNFGMSQLDLWIQSAADTFSSLLSSVEVDNNGLATSSDSWNDFDLYYGLLSQTHQWKHANPQAGLEMRNLKPLVYETWTNIGDNGVNGATSLNVLNASSSDTAIRGITPQEFRGSAHPLPLLNCTAVPENELVRGSGFSPGVNNYQTDVPAPLVYVAQLCIPPSRLHQLFYRMVVEWTLEFTQIRPIGDITSFASLAQIGQNTHAITYDYSVTSASTSSVLTSTTSTVNTTDGMDITKVM